MSRKALTAVLGVRFTKATSWRAFGMTWTTLGYDSYIFGWLCSRFIGLGCFKKVNRHDKSFIQPEFQKSIRLRDFASFFPRPAVSSTTLKQQSRKAIRKLQGGWQLEKYQHSWISSNILLSAPFELEQHFPFTAFLPQHEISHTLSVHTFRVNTIDVLCV